MWCVERSSNAQRPECNANDAVQVSVIQGWQGKDMDLVIERAEHTRRIVECQKGTNKSASQKRDTTDLTEGRQTQWCPGGAVRKQNRRLESAKTWLTGSKPRGESRWVDRSVDEGCLDECRRRGPRWESRWVHGSVDDVILDVEIEMSWQDGADEKDPCTHRGLATILEAPRWLWSPGQSYIGLLARLIIIHKSVSKVSYNRLSNLLSCVSLSDRFLKKKKNKHTIRDCESRFR